uniref:C-type lectin domain-containing protein n=1 Tax=Nothobranchius furzeri TaxID=105023 RepID=A0A8C6P590_NOTFU
MIYHATKYSHKCGSLICSFCQPCPTGWVQFETKCFLFYDENPPWKSWDQSRKFCQNKAADLVVVDNLQEQVKSGIITLTLKSRHVTCS